MHRKHGNCQTQGFDPQNIPKDKKNHNAIGLEPRTMVSGTWIPWNLGEGEAPLLHCFRSGVLPAVRGRIANSAPLLKGEFSATWLSLIL